MSIDWEAVYDIEALELRSSVIIFYDKMNNSFLLERRSKTNPVLGGEVIFPAEKGLGDFLKIAQRGVNEEMGKEVQILESKALTVFSHQVGSLGKGCIQPIVVTKWLGDIKNVEPDKGELVWIHRQDVMTALTNNESKLIFLMVLGNLNILEAADFINAPKMPMP